MSLPRSLQLGKWYVNGAGAVRVRKIRSWTQNPIFLRDRKQKNKFKRLGLQNLSSTIVINWCKSYRTFPWKVQVPRLEFLWKIYAMVACASETADQRDEVCSLQKPRSPFPFVFWMHIKVLVWGRTVLEAVAPLYSATGKMLGVQMYGLYRKKATMLYRIYINILSEKSKENF